MIKLGNRRSLRVNDLYSVIPGDESEVLGLALGRFACLYILYCIKKCKLSYFFHNLISRREWLKEVEKCKSKNERPSFFQTLLRLFGMNCVLPGVQIFLEECVVKYKYYVMHSIIKFLLVGKCRKQNWTTLIIESTDKILLREQ